VFAKKSRGGEKRLSRRNEEGGDRWSSGVGVCLERGGARVRKSGRQGRGPGRICRGEKRGVVGGAGGEGGGEGGWVRTGVGGGWGVKCGAGKEVCETSRGVWRYRAKKKKRRRKISRSASPQWGGLHAGHKKKTRHILKGGGHACGAFGRANQGYSARKTR